MSATDSTATKISFLLGLDEEQTAIVRDYGAAVAQTPAALLAALYPLLSYRRTRLTIYGPEKIGKTTSILGLAKALHARSGRGIDILNADGDAQVSVAATAGYTASTPITFASFRGDPDSPTAIAEHIGKMCQVLNRMNTIAAARLCSGQTSGVILDTVSAISSRLYAIAGLGEMDDLAQAGGKGAIAAMRLRMQVANIVRGAVVLTLSVGDWGDKVLTESPQISGPFVVGVVAHAKSMPQTKDGAIVFGSHAAWSINLSDSVRAGLLQQSDHILAFGPKTTPTGTRTPHDRAFVFEGEPHVNARLVHGDDEERRIAVAAARKASLADYVLGLYDHRIRRGLALLAAATAKSSSSSVQKG